MCQLLFCHYCLNNTMEQIFTEHLHYIRHYKPSHADLKYVGGCVKILRS